MVGQGDDAARSSADAVTLSADALADAAVNRPAIVSSKNLLTPMERAAVSAAAQAAVTEQDSLAPLFANLGAAISSSNLSAKLQAAIAQVLAQQTSLDQNLGGGDIKTAFQKSGIFLEASLAAGTVLPRGADAAAPHVAAASLAPSSSPDLDVQEILLPQARLVSAENLALAGQAARSPLAAALDAGPSSGATLNLLQEALQELGNPARAAATSKDGRGADVTFHANTPPPIRGALPAAQPIAQPTIAPHAPLEATAHHLLDDTDAAIARQTLLQVASLLDRVDTSGKADMTAPRWNFEIPFATPQGTAMAQFEISRDGGSEGVEAAKRVWRARFSLDVEPAGPVHALISLIGEKTSVRLWAERSATAERLRAGMSELSQALSRAELQPGDIVIRDGAPTQAEPAARAGHFLDRAL
jgi:hypothetical protein